MRRRAPGRVNSLSMAATAQLATKTEYSLEIYTMPSVTREEDRLTEDETARRKLGPRGVPGGEDTAKMTPQQAKNISKTGDFDGHTA
jgi:hypothetical protein